KRSRMDWSAFARLMRNFAQAGTSEDLFDAGRDTFRAPMMRYMGIIARALFDAQAFYQWVFQAQMGAGNQIFTCIEPSLEVVRPGALRLKMAIAAGQAPSEEFFHICRGNFTEMPVILGLKPAAVQMVLAPDAMSATYEV